MFNQSISIISSFWLLTFIVCTITACGGSSEEVVSSAQSQTPANVQSDTSAIKPEETLVTLSEDAQRVAKQYVIALEAARNEDWATVEQTINQILTITQDPVQVDVAKVLLGKLKANDTVEVMVHMMKLLSLPPDQAPISVWYREIYRHAKAQEWKQLDVELHETLAIAPDDVDPQIQSWIDKLARGETDRLAEEIKQFAGLSGEE